MLLRTLFGGVLAFVPLVASLEVEKCLGDELIGSLPTEEMQKLAIDIKGLLAQPNSSLHLDQPQTWGPSDLERFTNNYFPKLKELAIMAVERADFYTIMLGPNVQAQWPHKLKAALECLTVVRPLDSEYQKASDSASLNGLVRALSDLQNLKYAFWRFEKLRKDPGELTPQQWELATATIRPSVEIQLIVGFVKMLLSPFNMRNRRSAAILKLFNFENEGNFLDMKRTVDGLTAGLGPLFDSLRSTFKSLASTGCPQSWLSRLEVEWLQDSDLFRRMDAPHLPICEVLDHFRARFSSEQILLRLELAKWWGEYYHESNLSKEELCNFLVESTSEARQVFGDFLAMMQGFAAEHKASSADDFIAGVARFSYNIFERRITIMAPRFHYLGVVAKCLRNLRAKMLDDPTLGDETVERLKVAHGLARQIVEAYAAIFCLAEEKLDAEEARDKFLLKLFGLDLGIEHENLITAKGIMDYVEELLGPGVLPYDWGRLFPLYYWFPRPQRMTKSARSAAAAGEKKGELPGTSAAEEEGAYTEADTTEEQGKVTGTGAAEGGGEVAESPLGKRARDPNDSGPGTKRAKGGDLGDGGTRSLE